VGDQRVDEPQEHLRVFRRGPPHKCEAVRHRRSSPSFLLQRAYHVPAADIDGPSKAALEALSAIMAKDLDGTGVTVNVLVPGGITNTPMVSESGFDRAKMIQPEVMVSPLLWLVSDAAAKVTGRRFLGVHWDPALPPEQAAEKAGAPVAWTSIATMPITPSRS
jgi:hypothetical protein